MIEISRVEQHSDLYLQTFAAGDEGVILVEDYHPQESMLEIQAQINGPHERETSAWRSNRPARAATKAGFRLWGKGRYQVAIAGRRRRTQRTDHGRIRGRIFVRISPLPFRSHYAAQDCRRAPADAFLPARKPAKVVRHSARAKGNVQIHRGPAVDGAGVPDSAGCRRPARATGLERHARLVRRGPKDGIHRNAGRAVAAQRKSAPDHRRRPQERAGKFAARLRLDAASNGPKSAVPKPRQTRKPRHPPPSGCWP